MKEIFEALMIIAFGISWPINLYKSIKTKSAKGKSVLFLSFIMFGYISGIIGKIVTNNITYVFIFYIINLTLVTADFIMYFINRSRDNRVIKENK